MNRKLRLLFATLFAALLPAVQAQPQGQKPSAPAPRGTTQTTLRVGTLLPAKGALAEPGAAMRDVLTAYFQELNERGGVGGRRVELHFAETGDSPSATAANVRRLVVEGQVFALVGGMSAGADEELAALARELEVPFVGPSTLMPAAGANRHVFYTLPGVAEQARALVNAYAQLKTGTHASVVVVSVKGGPGEAAGAAAEGQCKAKDWPTLLNFSYERGKFDAASLARSLKGVDAVFFFGSAGDEAALLREADAAGARPHFYLHGALAGGSLLNGVPQGFKGKVFAAFPTVPSDVSPSALAELRALLEKRSLPVRNLSSQLAAYAAAKLFAEGMRRAGGEPSREKLVAALEALRDFETGVTPRLSFGPGRRVGAAGAYVMLIDVEKRQYVPAGGWVNAL